MWACCRVWWFSCGLILQWEGFVAGRCACGMFYLWLGFPLGSRRARTVGFSYDMFVVHLSWCCSPTSQVNTEVRWHSHRFDFVRLNVTCVLRVIMTRFYGVVQMNCTCTHPWVSHSIICNTYFIVSPVSRHLQMLLDYGALGMRSYHIHWSFTTLFLKHVHVQAALKLRALLAWPCKLQSSMLMAWKSYRANTIIIFYFEIVMPNAVIRNKT